MESAKGKRYVLVTADADAVLARLRRESESPRQDFVELTRALDAAMLSFADVARGSFLTRLLSRVFGPPVALAWLAFRKGGSFYFAGAENAAIPLAFLLKLRPRARLAFIAHRLTAPKKRGLLYCPGLFRQTIRIFCYSWPQERFAVERLRVPAERVLRIAFQVDEKFFSPATEPRAGIGVVSVGRELRDYPTLFRAMEGTEIPVTVVASSPWSQRRDSAATQAIPSNVTLRKGVSSAELRALYLQAAVVVVPLMNVDWPAGVTSLLEAQACGRPVVISASAGILDSLDFGTAVTVPCGDAAALRAAVLRLIRNPDEAANIGRAGREAVLRQRTLEQFVARIAEGCNP